MHLATLRSHRTVYFVLRRTVYLVLHRTAYLVLHRTVYLVLHRTVHYIARIWRTLQSRRGKDTSCTKEEPNNTTARTAIMSSNRPITLQRERNNQRNINYSRLYGLIQRQPSTAWIRNTEEYKVWVQNRVTEIRS